MSEIYSKFGYLACWLPSMHLELGDVGRLEDRRFVKITTLNDLGIAAEVGLPGPRADLEYSSTNAVSVTVEADAGLGGAPSDGSSTLSIKFGRGGATFFQAGDSVLHSFTDLHTLEADILRLCETGVWRKDWAVVTTVLCTGPTAILIANESNAHVALRISSDGVGVPLAVARASGKLTVTNTSGLAVRFLASEGATPLYGAAQVRRKVVGRSQMVFRSARRPVELGLAPVSWDDPELD